MGEILRFCEGTQVQDCLFQLEQTPLDAPVAWASVTIPKDRLARNASDRFRALSKLVVYNSSPSIPDLRKFEHIQTIVSARAPNPKRFGRLIIACNISQADSEFQAEQTLLEACAAIADHMTGGDAVYEMISTREWYAAAGSAA